MNTEGVIVALVVSLLVNVTVVPPGGAGEGNVIGNGTVWPTFKDTLDGRPMGPDRTTVTAAVVLLSDGREPAVIVAEPEPTPVTGTLTLEAFAGKLTVGGTVAAEVLLELKLIVRPGGANPVKFNVRFWVAPAARVSVFGENVIPPTTCTCWLAVMNPEAVALIFAAPKLTPVTCGCVAGVIAVAGMKTLAGEIVTFEVSLLARLMVTPPAGAPVSSVIGNDTDRPGFTVTPLGRAIAPNSPTVTLVSPLKYPLALAVIVVVP
jgi:hypothetical protein